MNPTVRIHYPQLIGHLSTRLKVGMGERAGSLKELPHMAPAAMPVTSTVLVRTVDSHSTQAAHHNTPSDMVRVPGTDPMYM